MNKLLVVFKVVSLAAVGLVGAAFIVLLMLFLVMRDSFLLSFVGGAALALQGFPVFAPSGQARPNSLCRVLQLDHGCRPLAGLNITQEAKPLFGRSQAVADEVGLVVHRIHTLQGMIEVALSGLVINTEFGQPAFTGAAQVMGRDAAPVIAAAFHSIQPIPNGGPL